MTKLTPEQVEKLEAAGVAWCTEQQFAALCREWRERGEALEPFTQDAFSRTLGGNVEGDSSIVFQREKAKLRLGDFRRARAALKGADHED